MSQPIEAPSAAPGAASSLTVEALHIAQTTITADLVNRAVALALAACARGEGDAEIERLRDQEAAIARELGSRTQEQPS